jgi:hypothetical protein
MPRAATNTRTEDPPGAAVVTPRAPHGFSAVHGNRAMFPATRRRQDDGFAPMRLPSGPREVHPRPLTDPDVKVSLHPARVTPQRPAGRPRTPPGSSRCRLARRHRAGDPPPSLPGRSPSSARLRGGPSLPGASVLSASWAHRSGLFPWHHRDGAHVPYRSPGRSPATYTPDTTGPVGRWPPCCSQASSTNLVLMSSKRF